METIIIADDHPVILSGISQYVATLGYKVLDTYTSGITAYNNIVALRPNYAILDINMPGMNGLEVLEKVRTQNSQIKIILYTMYHDTSLFEKAKNLKVNGYVLKDFALEELKSCLEILSYKHQWFSPRLTEKLVFKDHETAEEKLLLLSAAERKIIYLVAKGKSSKEISQQLFITEKTVENHRSSIIKKIGLTPGNNALTNWALKQTFE